MDRVLVLGSGNGGLATAGDLSLRGLEVHLGELPGFEKGLEPVRSRGGIQLEALPSTGLKEGFAPVNVVDQELGSFLKAFQGLILAVMPAFAHRTAARLLAPHIHRSQIVVLCPGYMGVLELVLELASLGRDHLLGQGLILGEMESLIYACRKKDEGTIWVRGYKRGLRAAAFPASQTEGLMRALDGKFDQMEAAENVLELALSNANALIHTPLMLLNGARIESPGDFLFYHEGMTPSVGRLIESMDRERLEIGQSYGLQELRDIFNQDLGWYKHQGASGQNIYDTHITNPIYRWSKAPGSLEHRYVTEDVPYGLVLMEELARPVSAECPTISSVITVFSALLDQDLRDGARTLNSLGIGGLSADEITRLVDRGDLSEVGQSRRG